jgi:sigma-B regulation protein RsbU (phosphoserine phosphatase)
MVTVIKSLFIAGAGGCDLPEFLAAAASSIRRMELGRMAMALAVARLDGDRLEVSSAGMPPVLVRRASGELEEIALQGLPLGGMAQPSYQRHEVALAADDIVLLMSDGLPELPNGEGEPFGYARLRRTVDECAGCSPQEIITRLAASADNWTGGRPPGDDVTFVVVKVR